MSITSTVVDRAETRFIEAAAVLRPFVGCFWVITAERGGRSALSRCQYGNLSPDPRQPSFWMGAVRSARPSSGTPFRNGRDADRRAPSSGRGLARERDVGGSDGWTPRQAERPGVAVFKAGRDLHDHGRGFDQSGL